MSPPIETGCSEVSTTVTLLDGNTSAIKDDSSRSTTTSPIIEPSREHEKNAENSTQEEYNENQRASDKSKQNENIKGYQKTNDDKNNIEDDNDKKDEDRLSLLKKYDYLGLYNNRPTSPEHSTVHGNKLSSDNNNRKTNNAKVRLYKNLKTRNSLNM